MTAKKDPRSERAHIVDLHVGSRVRERRRSLRISQGELAEQVGITFQQVQKYERGSNRISASKLYQISQALQVPAAWFFTGCAGAIEEQAGPPNDDVRTFLSTIEALSLGEAYLGIRSDIQRQRVVDLMRTIAADQ